MSFLIVLAALCFLMFVAYRGYSVILFAPVAALGAVLLTDPTLVQPMFTGLFMDKMVGFLKLYFPVFVLGAVFGVENPPDVGLLHPPGGALQVVVGEPESRPYRRRVRDVEHLGGGDATARQREQLGRDRQQRVGLHQ